MKNLQLILISLMILASCNNVKEKTKETLNEGGEIVGKTATEIVEGIKEGVDKTLECDIQLSQELKDKGIKTGKYTIENDSLGGKNNILVLYLIFEKDFNKAITVKAMDKNGLETGRSRISITAKAGNAGYFDFKFDKRTYIEVKSKIEVE